MPIPVWWYRRTTQLRDSRVRDRMVVGFTTAYAIGAYHQ